jgi:beta-lactamase regulating signal transducer with metallopeptidase domain
MGISFFAAMAWKSALISGAALALAYLLRSRAAADRATVLRLGVAMLLLLPVIALVLPALRIEAWAAPAAPPPPAAQLARLPAYVPADLAFALPADAGPQPAAPTIWDDPTPLVLLAYLGGLLMVGGRLLVGLALLRRWTRSAAEVTCPEWRAAFERARRAAPDAPRLRLLVADGVPSPLSWGWRNPAILIDPDTLAEPREADAILAHEVAHVARRDWPALLLTRLAAALFWFNPLVWLLDREAVQQAEEAADCAAAARVEPTHYARTLLSLAQVNGRLIPANGIAPKGGALARRIRAILDRRLRERPAGSAWTTIAVLLCIGIAAPVAAMELVEAAQAPAAPRAPRPPAAPEAPLPPPAPGAPDAPRAPLPPAPPADVAEVPDVPDAPEVPDAAPAVREALAEVLPRIPQIVAEASQAAAEIDPEAVQRSVDAALAAAGPEVRHMSREDRERIREEVRHAVAEARAQARADPARIARLVAEAQRIAATAPRAMAVSMASGAQGMARGADGMEAGARRMAEQAARFRDRAYRDQVIAREAARGHTVTHEQLLEAARGMEEGARGMREGAEEMRRAAERMGSTRDD